MKNKYQREILPGTYIDVYDVLTAFNVTCPARAHAIKKLLATGARGHKDEMTDLKEAIQSLERSTQILQKQKAKGLAVNHRAMEVKL